MLERNDQITLDMFVEKWWKIGLCTDPADRPTAEWAMRWLYKTQQKRQPRIEWMTSLRAITEIVESDPRPVSIINISQDVFDSARPASTASALSTLWQSSFRDLENALERNIIPPIVIEASRGTSFDMATVYFVGSGRPFIEGQFLAGILGLYDYLTNVEDKDKELGFEVYGLTNLAVSAGFVLALEDVCYISERPISILLDEDNRLHGEGAPAVAYGDGFGIWAWHGNLVGERVIKREFNWEDIQSQNNVEIRRSMIDIYGAGNFLVDAGAKELHSDGFGTLYQLESQISSTRGIVDEPLVMVKVVNSTPEPDGSYKDYFLRVPPGMETAEQAVAWTFGMEGSQEYRPQQES